MADTTAGWLEELRNGPPTVSVVQAAKYLGISRSHAYASARDGSLPTIRIGGRVVRVPAIALLRMLDA